MNETRMAIRDTRISSSSSTSSTENNEEPADDVSTFIARSDKLIQRDDSFLPQLTSASPQYESAVWPKNDMTLEDSTESGTSLHRVCFECDPPVNLQKLSGDVQGGRVSKHHPTVGGSCSNGDDERIEECKAEMTRSASDEVACPSADDSHNIPFIDTHYNGTEHVLDVELEQGSERICRHARPEPEVSYTKPGETSAQYAENCEPVNVLCPSSAACHEATVRSKAYDESLSVKDIRGPHGCQDEHLPDQQFIENATSSNKTEDVVLFYDPQLHLCTLKPVTQSLLSTNKELYHEAQSVAVEGLRPSKPMTHQHCLKHKHKRSSCSSSKYFKPHRTDNDTFGKNAMKAEEKKDNAGMLSRCARSGDDPAMVPNAPSKSEARLGEGKAVDSKYEEAFPNNSIFSVKTPHMCYPTATDSRSDGGSVASSSTTTDDDFLFKRPWTPPKRPKKLLPRYATDDPEEIKDNESPEWEPFRGLTTDEERYKAVWKVWHNSAVPDPQLDLSVFNYGQKHVGPKPSNLCLDRQSHERAGSCNRLWADIEIYDKKIRQVVKEKNRALSKAHEDLNRDMRHLYRTRRKEEKSESLRFQNFSLERKEHRRSHTPPRDSHYWRMQERKIRDDFRAKEEEIINTHSAKLIKLRRAKEEVSRFNTFYAGLLDSDPLMLSPNPGEGTQDVGESDQVHGETVQ
ncbi:hypothetical protein HPB49_022481 [Dermacentor silvarum]|uniref:Uncharacterized protein n=1 Tax=Dermacentor silvarum TaxID=543639 RepID=A0ACB8E3N4_DERSI|nr:hypothetical protein HPB49_022481 [Dermacentor silvarum]